MSGTLDELGAELEKLEAQLTRLRDSLVAARENEGGQIDA